jgi:hypothetical protein
MKNWAIITIFLAVMVFSAAAQQPIKPQAANPAELTTVASEKPMSQPIPGSLNTNRALPLADLKKMAEDSNEHQRKEIEQHNQQLRERFTALQQAGGWQRVFLTQLKLQWLQDPNVQLNAAQQFITSFVFCDQPAIAERTSEFQPVTNNVRLDTVSKQFAVGPMASVIINGCSFGPETGEVRLILNHDPSSSVPLQVSDWSDSSIFAKLGANPGVSDQDAQLVVVRKDGTQSKPITVQFSQHQMFQVTGSGTAAERSLQTF